MRERKIENERKKDQEREGDAQRVQHLAVAHRENALPTCWLAKQPLMFSFNVAIK